MWHIIFLYILFYNVNIFLRSLRIRKKWIRESKLRRKIEISYNSTKTFAQKNMKETVVAVAVRLCSQGKGNGGMNL